MLSTVIIIVFSLLSLQQQLVLGKSVYGDASFLPPAVSYQWRPEKTQKQFKKLQFPTDYPLTVEMMQKGMPRLSTDELYRFLPLMSRLSEQQAEIATTDNTPVTIVSLGGSFALGTQCCVGNSWPNRFVTWLRAAYPLANISHIEYLKGSTNSLFGASVVRELSVSVDLLLLGYALNDEVIINNA
jgi:hypothetical protein